jgi:hypothetical protein
VLGKSEDGGLFSGRVIALLRSVWSSNGLGSFLEEKVGGFL